jgi:protein-S-isoprenylcysteine O-methyltransferase Ste14
MFVLFRTLTYATLFIGFLLVYLPSRVLLWSGIVRPAIHAPQIAGIAVATAGALLALCCIATFVAIGKGTPAPFDPPRRLVVRGPYRFVRNPMYLGGALTLAGAALFYQSMFLLVYGCIFGLAFIVFVLLYEEPTLRRTFGADYEAYCLHVGRWLPHR